MRRISKLRVSGDDYKIAPSEERAATRERGTLHARNDRRINRTQTANTRAQADKKLFDAPWIFCTGCKVKSRAKRCAITAEDDDIDIVAIDKKTRFCDALLKHTERLCMQRVSMSRSPKYDGRHAAVRFEARRIRRARVGVGSCGSRFAHGDSFAQDGRQRERQLPTIVHAPKKLRGVLCEASPCKSGEVSDTVRGIECAARNALNRCGNTLIVTRISGHAVGKIAHQLAGVAVRNCCENGPPCCEILERLTRDDHRRHTTRHAVQTEKQRVCRFEKRRTARVFKLSVQYDSVLYAGAIDHFLCPFIDDTSKVKSDALAERGLTLTQNSDRTQEVERAASCRLDGHCPYREEVAHARSDR
jgi:hypothetical protein